MYTLMAMAIFFSLTEPRWTCFYVFFLFKNNKKKKEKFFQHAYMFSFFFLAIWDG